MLGKKLFLDAVHGYIAVPVNFSDELIDTAPFQRLRRIEQTSARSLFPCAHHDRFVHSLGVYYVGQQIVDAINISFTIPQGIRQSYLIACLMHDCGHSPFSHTFEHLFGTPAKLFEDYKSVIKSHNMDASIQDIDINKSDAKPHEIISAILCVTMYYEKIIKLGGNPALVGRMIMGLPYVKEERNTLENCFISLLHGEVIDADRIDYICRDRWASGYMNTLLDVRRLIAAIRIKKKNNEYIVTFKKNAINEIQALIDSKNFQQTTVFTHHQVVYEQKLLKDAVENMIKALQEDGNLDPAKLFNYHAFETPQEVCPGLKVYLPMDDDIISLMKTYQEKIPTLEQWLSRSYTYYPLWKSRAEFLALFSSAGEASILLSADMNIFDNVFKDVIVKEIKEEPILLAANPKMKKIHEGEILVDFGDTEIDYTALNLPVEADVYKGQMFEYVYVPNAFQDQKSVLIEKLIIATKSYIVKRKNELMAKLVEATAEYLKNKDTK